MTDELQAKVMRLWLPACDECRPAQSKFESMGHYEIYPDTPCPRCDGLGVTLRDATRENWPWWRIGGGDYGCHEDRPYFAFIPDFPSEPAAALVLAEKMNSDWTYPMQIEPPFWEDGTGHGWEIRGGQCDPEGTKGEGPTLGTALLAAAKGERGDG